MPTSTLTAKGQTTVPKAVRDALRLKTGDRIEFVVEGDGRVLLRAAHADVTELAGLLNRPGLPAVPLDDMDRAVEREASAAFRRP